MNPDISYIVIFEKSKKSQIIESLGDFCVNSIEDDSFNSALISNDCMLSFIVDIEESLNWYYESYEYSRRINGKILIGLINLWIKEQQNNITFTFWAPTSSAGKACLASKNLFNELIKWLEKNDGLEIQLQHTDGFIETIYERN